MLVKVSEQYILAHNNVDPLLLSWTNCGISSGTMHCFLYALHLYTTTYTTLDSVGSHALCQCLFTYTSLKQQECDGGGCQ